MKTGARCASEGAIVCWQTTSPSIILLIDARSLIRYVAIRRAGARTAPGRPVRQVVLRPDTFRGQGKRQVGDASGLRRDRHRQHGRVPNLARRWDAGLGTKASSTGGAAERSPAQTFLCVIAMSPGASGWRMSSRLNRRLAARSNRRTDRTHQPPHLRWLPAARIRSLPDEISVLLFDIDNFKGYNDSYGTPGRRPVRLQAVARRSATRPRLRPVCQRVMVARNSLSRCRIQRRPPR